jgi:hypothetical protein
MKFSSENHSGDVNNHSGRIVSSSISARNRYSHRVGIIIHITPERLFTCPGIRTPGGMVADRVATGRKRTHQILGIDAAAHYQAQGFDQDGQTPLDHRTGL